MRTSEHPSIELLTEFLRASTSPEDAKRVEGHLLRGCIRCLRTMHMEVIGGRLKSEGRKLRPRARVRQREGYLDVDEIRREAAVVDRRASLVEAERIVAPELLQELLLLAPDERRTALRAGGRYAFFGLAELLIRECRSECFRDVSRAVELGVLAVESAGVLSREVYPRAMVADSLALAWAALGNAHRVRADLVDAERALLTGWELILRGSGDRVARAEVLSLLGSLRMDQARFEEASAALRQATEIWQAEGNRVQEGKLRIQLAHVLSEAGDVERGVALAAEARSLLADGVDERLYLIAGQTLATWLREAGRIEDARATFDDLEPAFRATIDDPTSLIRLDWLHARLLWSEGAVDRAEEELLAVRERYQDRDEPKRYCLVSLDLAILYLEQGRTAEVRELARQLAPVFASRRVHHHALAALVLFKQAAEADEVSIGFVRELARYLHHSRKNPYLKFQPSGA